MLICFNSRLFFIDGFGVETQYFASPAIQSGFAIWICIRETQNIASLQP
jgi:hypothetical protein